MTVWVRTILFFLALVVLGTGCSGNEEPPPPAEKPKIVKRIIKPPPREAERPAPALKPDVEPEMKAEEKQTPPPAAQKTAKPAAPVTPTPPPARETAKPAVAMTPGTPGTPAAPPAREAGVYVVKKGESLSDIAKRENVFGDPLKWAILYRLNAEKLATLGKGADLPDQALPEGLRLKIITPEEAKANLEKRDRHLWIVNILSATDRDKIVPAAVTLMQQGYPVYITSATVKGKDWMRLRLGFFDSRESATAEGEKVLALLRFSGLWTTKVSEDELKDFGRY